MARKGRWAKLGAPGPQVPTSEAWRNALRHQKESVAFSGCEVVPGLEARGPALEGGDLALSWFLGKGADQPDTREPQTAERTGFPAPAQLLQPLPQPRVTRPRPAQLQAFDLNPAWMQPPLATASYWFRVPWAVSRCVLCSLQGAGAV